MWSVRWGTRQGRLERREEGKPPTDTLFFLLYLWTIYFHRQLSAPQTHCFLKYIWNTVQCKIRVSWSNVECQMWNKFRGMFTLRLLSIFGIRVCIVHLGKVDTLFQEFNLFSHQNFFWEDISLNWHFLEHTLGNPEVITSVIPEYQRLKPCLCFRASGWLRFLWYVCGTYV